MTWPRTPAAPHPSGTRATTAASPDRSRARVPFPPAAPLRRGSTGVFERIRALPETRLVDGLLRGRVWIWLLGILLGGIVAMQVSLLKLNAGISRAVTTTGTLERANADIEAQNAKLAPIERVRDAATAEGMVALQPGDLSYLHARGDRDASLAARRMAPPSDDGAGDHGQQRLRARRARRGHGAADDRPRRPWPRPIPPPPTATDAHRRRQPRYRRPRRCRPRRLRPPRRRRRRAAGVARCGSSSAASASSSPSSSACSLLGLGKAAWLGVVKAGTLKQAAAVQQKADITVPARRGAIMDRYGTELAVSQPAVTVAATPYLVKDAGGGGERARAAARRARGRPDQAARAPRHRVRLSRAPHPGVAGEPREADEDRGARVHPRVQADLPARLDGFAAARRHRHRQPGPVGARVLARQVPAWPRRRAQDDQGRARRRDPAAGHDADGRRIRTCGSRSTARSRTAPSRCWRRSARRTSPRAPPRS